MNEQMKKRREKLRMALSGLCILADDDRTPNDREMAAGMVRQYLGTPPAIAFDSAPKTKPKRVETASALSSALAQIKALTDRVAKMEKASAMRSTPVPKDHVVSMIEAAERNTLRNLPNRAARTAETEMASAIGHAPSATASLAVVDVAMIEAAGRNVLRTLGK